MAGFFHEEAAAGDELEAVFKRKRARSRMSRELAERERVVVGRQVARRDLRSRPNDRPGANDRLRVAAVGFSDRFRDTLLPAYKALARVSRQLRSRSCSIIRTMR